VRRMRHAVSKELKPNRVHRKNASGPFAGKGRCFCSRVAQGDLSRACAKAPTGEANRPGPIQGIVPPHWTNHRIRLPIRQAADPSESFIHGEIIRLGGGVAQGIA
jgi:hypothetical protein